MEIYLYCNYTNSRLGFRLTRLTGERLEPVTLYASQDKGEQAVDRFFSFDRYHVLWQEIQIDDKNIFNPEPAKSLFGIRGIHGRISDRDGIVNIAILSEAEELDIHECLARGILSDMKSFCQGIFSYITVGGENGYELAADGFRQFLDYFEGLGQSAQVPFYIGNGMTSAKDLLRFGVYSGDRNEALSDIGPSWMWLIKPKQLISSDKFRETAGVTLY